MPKPVEIDAPPAPGTYGRVLRREDLDPSTNPPVISTYSFTETARRCEMGGEVAFTVFFPPGPAGDYAAVRPRRQGWHDVTEQWLAEHGQVETMPWRSLRALAASLGLQTGGAKGRSGAKSRAEVERDVREALGLDTDEVLRSAVQPASV